MRRAFLTEVQVLEVFATEQCEKVRWRNAHIVVPRDLGQRVGHPKFGEGVIIDFEGQGSHARINVNFAREGAKWLVLSYANLQAI